MFISLRGLEYGKRQIVFCIQVDRPSSEMPMLWLLLYGNIRVFNNNKHFQLF